MSSRITRTTARALLLLSCFAFTSGQAADYSPWALQINLASYHPNASEDYNEFNRGVGVEYHKPNYFLAGGYFWNSLYRDTLYAGIGKEWNLIAENFGAGIIGGAITGYRDGQRPYPAAIPYVYLSHGRYTFKIHYIPEFGDVEDDAFGFALRIRFDR